MTPVYTAVAKVTGGREGRAQTDDGRLDLPLSVPRELGGSGGRGTNPEQLFAVAYAACFESALLEAARNHGKNADGASVTASVTLLRNDGAGYQLKVDLYAQIPGLSQHEIHELLQAAHQACPYSKATRGNIEVTLIARGILNLTGMQSTLAESRQAG
jgi:osmotically inducible protein OsmC